MTRSSLVSLLVVLFVGLPEGARAADPPAGAATADPFAPPPEGGQPSSTEDQEAAVLGAPARPAPTTQSPPPAPPPPPARRPTAASRPRKAQAADEEQLWAGAAPAEPSGVALELSTSGFASGALAGGLFLGGRTASGLILGGFLDYGMSSLSVATTGTDVTSSVQFVRLGAGLRHSFARSADRLVDLYGAADASFEYRSAERVSSSGTAPTETLSAAGFSLALGPGLRLWVHEQIAIGYVARFRMTYLSGELGALDAESGDSVIDSSLTAIGFDGTFQLLGIF